MRLRSLVAGFGSLIGGFLVYVSVSGMSGDIDLETRLTFDQGGELELEGVSILAGLVLGAVIGAPLGTYLALRLMNASAAGATTVAVAVLVAAFTMIAFWAVPSGSAPYVVFGGWLLLPMWIRHMFEQRLRKETTTDIH